MSDYHIIDVAREKNRATVAFHFAVPDENNVQGTALSTCLVERNLRDEKDTSRVPTHLTNFATENAELVAGTMVEYVETIEFDANETNANKLAVITARYSVLASIAPDWLREELKFWGYHGDVT